MQPSNMRVESLTDERLQELAAQPNTTVMKPVHDVTFEPWPPEEIETIMDTLIKLTKEFGSKASALALKDAKMKRFSETHVTMFSKLTNENFCADSRKVAIFRAMIATRKEMVKGNLSEFGAREKLTQIALQEMTNL